MTAVWLLLLAPVLALAALSLLAFVRRTPALPGADPAALRTVVVWRDGPAIAADVAGDAHEQLRQLVGALAERRYIFSASLDRTPSGTIASVDVLDRRLEIRLRTHRGGHWLLWIDERGNAPADSDDLRQLLTGLYRTLEERGEGSRWFRREDLALADARGAPSPFYVA